MRVKNRGVAAWASFIVFTFSVTGVALAAPLANVDQSPSSENSTVGVDALQQIITAEHVAASPPVLTEQALVSINAYLEAEAQAQAEKDRQLQEFLAEQAKTPPGEQSYRAFTTCTEAVNYLFAGRWDQARAIKVVMRESTNHPQAANGSHLGCGQASQGMRDAYLSGPWDDPYYAVLLIRRVADDVAKGGWCHWDLVNYCAPGGEF